MIKVTIHDDATDKVVVLKGDSALIILDREEDVTVCSTGGDPECDREMLDVAVDTVDSRIRRDRTSMH